MGHVYEAEQEKPKRTVALKVIKAGVASPELLRRFEHETEALGRLQHPGIAQIYSAGTAQSPDGPQPFFAMELVRGEHLIQYVQSNSLDVRRCLELMARVCDAIHHAHQRGLIHRDLKPANILVDHSGQPKILDFGVARLADVHAQETGQTDVGQLIGTVYYMSPEQVLGDPRELDIRSDVYTLGVILYELIAGRLPYDVRNRPLFEVVEVIRSREATSLGLINRAWGGDIQTIVSKALEKEKDRRYGSAAEFASDIRRYLNNEPLAARPGTVAYQLRKFTARHRAAVLGFAAVLFVLVAGTIVSAFFALRAREAERAAVRDAAVARAVNDFLQSDLLAQASSTIQARPNVTPDPNLTVRTAVDRAADRVATRFNGQPEVEASIRHTIGTTYTSLGLYSQAADQLRRAVDLRQRLFGAEQHPDLLASQASLAAAHYFGGAYAFDNLKRNIAPNEVWPSGCRIYTHRKIHCLPIPREMNINDWPRP